MKIRQLLDTDWIIWKDIRLEALNGSPQSFASSYEEEANWTDTTFQNELRNGHVLGVFIDEQLVACAGFYQLNSPKTKHRGAIWGMYTRPEYRKKGIATALLQSLIQHAKTCISQLHLTCVTSNHAACSFYKKQGFRIYGTEPKALKINDNFYDEYLMALDLKEQPMKKLDSCQPIDTGRMPLKLSVAENPTHEDVQVLTNGIKDYAKQIKGFESLDFFACFIRDENNKIIGGCSGGTLYGCLHIDNLWVSEPIRQQGWGTRLMHAAMKYGQEKGCAFATVNTMDWEALEFYKKLEFEIEFERHGFQKNSVFYFLRKSL